jgi:hypothetical protein
VHRVRSIVAASVIVAAEGVAHAQAPPPPAPAPTVAPAPPVYSPAPAPAPTAKPKPRVVPDWDPDEPTPPGYHVETHVRKGFIIGGAIPLGFFWGISVLVAAVGNEVALYVPAIGPFVEFTKVSRGGDKFLAAFDGIVQAGGLFMLVYGIAVPRVELVENVAGVQLELTPRPFMTRGGGGMGWSAHF